MTAILALLVEWWQPIAAVIGAFAAYFGVKAIGASEARRVDTARRDREELQRREATDAVVRDVAADPDPAAKLHRDWRRR